MSICAEIIPQPGHTGKPADTTETDPYQHLKTRTEFSTKYRQICRISPEKISDKQDKGETTPTEDGS
jgi:hypothetical protein